MFLKDTQVLSFKCFVFHFWVLHFRDLGAPFSSFGCFVFETTMPNMQKIVDARAVAHAIYCKRVTKSYLC